MDDLAALLDRIREILAPANGPYGARPAAALARLRDLSDGAADPETFGSDPLDVTLMPHLATVELLAEVVRKARTILAPRLLPAGWDSIVATANQDVTDVQNVDHADLRFPVTPGGVYAVESLILYSGSSNAGDFAYRFAVDAGAFDCVGHSTGDSAANAAVTVRTLATNAAVSSLLPHGHVSDVDAPHPASGQFTFRARAGAGEVRLQFGNNVTGAGRVSRVWAGSYLRVKRIA